MDMAPLIVHYVNQERHQDEQSTEVLRLIPYWRAVWATQLALIALRANISRVSPDVSGALYLDHSRVEHALQEWSRHIGVTQAVKAMRLLMRYYHARCVFRAGLILETMCNNRDIAHCIASFLWSDRSWQGCPSQVVCLCGFFSIWVVSVLCSRCRFSAAKMKDKMCQCPWVMRSMDRCATTGTSLARIDFLSMFAFCSEFEAAGELLYSKLLAS